MRALIWLVCLTLLSACGKPEPASAPPTATIGTAAKPTLPAAARTQLAQLVEQTQKLAQAAQALTRTPDDAHLKSAQAAWQTAYSGFNQSLIWLLGNEGNRKLIS